MTTLLSNAAVRRSDDSIAGHVDTPLTRDRSRWSSRVRPPRGSRGSSHGDVRTSSGLSFKMRESIGRHRVAEPQQSNSVTNAWRRTMTDRLSRHSDTLNAVDKLSSLRYESSATETGFRPVRNHSQRCQQTVSKPHAARK